MPSFSSVSKERLKECDSRIQTVLNEAIKYYDFSVLCGHRGEEEQNEAYRKGHSKLKYPQSNHNKNPSKAVDVAPYPIDWKNHKRFYFLAGIILLIAKKKNISLRWGGHWKNFVDLPHFEIKE
jgi:peptidoglycan L-alanyl-D-glutamate endopeptidase CwlK